MKIAEKRSDCSGRSDVITIYPIGDCHIGTRNCAEKHLRRFVAEIAADKNAYWFGGGDVLDCINPKDAKRFDFDTLPDWILDGGVNKIRKNLNSIVDMQIKRAIDIFNPIKHKCLGCIEGNHEIEIRRHYNDDVQTRLCSGLDVDDMTDSFFMRIGLARSKSVGDVINLFAWHGSGGGRTAGAEPNHLARMQSIWEAADISLRGHSHTFDILPPKPVLFIPSRGALPDELLCRYRWSGNWGCWVKGYMAGQSTYDSRACYPPRPLGTIKAVIRPFRGSNGKSLPTDIKLETVILG